MRSRGLPTVFLALAGLAAAAPSAMAGAVISNGTVALGVNDRGQLNFTDATRFVGVTYEPTGFDGTRQGLPAEGWGAGAVDPGGNFSGSANNNVTGPEGLNVDLVSFTSTASTAASVVSIDDRLEVTHDFVPSPNTPNLYEIKVTLRNIGGTALPDVRYRRVMDWDVEPTPTAEFVTIQRGSTPAPGGNLIFSNDNGFDSADPLAPPAAPINPASVNADYVDLGPEDHGALFDFSFGSLAAGASKSFLLYYGAAGTETTANAAVSSTALELYSLGQTTDGSITGEPNTFIWGFRGVGGTPVIPPTLSLTPETASDPIGGQHTLTAELRDSSANPVPGMSTLFLVTGANTTSASVTTGADGKALFTYTGANAGSDSITACLDNNTNGACDSDEVRDTASKTWVAPTRPSVVQPPRPIVRPVSIADRDRDGIPDALDTSDASVGPTLARTVVAKVVRGTVLVKYPAGFRPRATPASGFVPLKGAEIVPIGSTVDSRRGRLTLTSVASNPGAPRKTQSADFSRGIFQIKQARTKKPVTELKLDSSQLRKQCRSRAKGASAASARGRRSSRRVISQLSGNGKGRFRTRGRNSTATVRGTIWLTQERCDGTLTKVQRGSVTVRDLRARRTITVRAGRSYLARATRAAAKRKSPRKP